MAEDKSRKRRRKGSNGYITVVKDGTALWCRSGPGGQEQKKAPYIHGNIWAGVFP